MGDQTRIVWSPKVRFQETAEAASMMVKGLAFGVRQLGVNSSSATCLLCDPSVPPTADAIIIILTLYSNIHNKEENY